MDELKCFDYRIEYDHMKTKLSATEAKLRELAEAIVKTWADYITGDFESYVLCIYCGASYVDWNMPKEMVVHNPGCPVLVAQAALKAARGKQ